MCLKVVEIWLSYKDTQGCNAATKGQCFKVAATGKLRENKDTWRLQKVSAFKVAVTG